MAEGFYNTAASVKAYIQMAEGHDGREHIAKLKILLPKGSTVLELGSGPGTDWKNLSANYQTTGSDYSPEFIKHLRSMAPEGTFLQLDAATLGTNQTFDAIYSNKVLHHLSDEAIVRSFSRQYQLLNSGGLICHSFWKGEGSETFKGLFVNYHNKDGLHSLIANRFEVLSLESYQEFETSDSLLLVAKKVG